MKEPESAQGRDRPHESSHALDGSRLERAAKNLAALLTDLIDVMENFESKSAAIRKRTRADIDALFKALPEPDRGLLLTRLAVETQRILDEHGSPKVSVDGGCLGRPGVSITATQNGVSAGACVIGDTGGIKGGGVTGGVSY